jgi:hypothetical protein
MKKELEEHNSIQCKITNAKKPYKIKLIKRPIENGSKMGRLLSGKND